MTQNSGLMKGKRDSGYHVVGMKRPDAPDISLARE